MAVARGLLLGVLALALLAAPPATDAQPATKLPRVGFLRLGTQAESEYAYREFRQGLRDLGYVEGETVALEARFAGDDVTRLPALAMELVRRKGDIIVTSAVPAIRAASRASPTIPIVLVSADPVGAGLVASLARLGGNVPGLADPADVLARLGLRV